MYPPSVALAANGEVIFLGEISVTFSDGIADAGELPSHRAVVVNGLEKWLRFTVSNIVENILNLKIKRICNK